MAGALHWIFNMQQDNYLDDWALHVSGDKRNSKWSWFYTVLAMTALQKAAEAYLVGLHFCPRLNLVILLANPKLLGSRGLQALVDKNGDGCLEDFCRLMELRR
ncbi:hypothetical protein BDE02_05G206100 [Populus trichocarpa]|nr:hypothetical protein BDE02_05G206100 [Populus trichocarpa]